MKKTNKKILQMELYPFLWVFLPCVDIHIEPPAPLFPSDVLLPPKASILCFVLFSCIYISYLRFLVGSIIMHITGYSVMDNAIYSTWKSKRAAFPHPASRVAYNFSGHPVIHITAQCRRLWNPSPSIL